jgi:Fur family zinc uptake transcriptional regulator
MKTNLHNHSICQIDALLMAEALCEARGLKFTKIRRRVFDIIWQSHKALAATEIMQLLDNKQPPITYRALEFLQSNGLIHHVASLNAYIGCAHLTHNNHVGQLLICTSCHNVAELEPVKPMMALVRAADAQRFNISHTHIEMLGTCHTCQTQGAAATPYSAGPGYL